MSGPPAVVFDLDGTLVDSAPDLVATLNTIFAREGLPPVAYASARNMVGGGARAMIERGLKAEGRTLADAEVDRLFHDFIAHYSAISRTARARSRASRPRSTSFPTAAAASRCAPTSLSDS